MPYYYYEVFKVDADGKMISLRTYPDFMLDQAKKYCRWLTTKDQRVVLYEFTRCEVEFDDC